jgi:hypothetical protein
MNVIIDGDQVRRLGFNFLDKIYGPLKKYPGILYTDILVDQNMNPRIAFHNLIFNPKTVFILKGDFLKFKSIIPLNENDFASLLKEWLERNYGISEFETLTTTKPEKMRFRIPRHPQRPNYSY